jgi:hypothetical protein
LPVTDELEHWRGLIGNAVLYLSAWLLGRWWSIVQSLPQKRQLWVRLHGGGSAVPIGEARIFYRLQFAIKLHGTKLCRCLEMSKCEGLPWGNREELFKY